jgi:hypothetical protein
MIDSNPEKPSLVAIDLLWMMVTIDSTMWPQICEIINANGNAVRIIYNNRDYHLCVRTDDSSPCLESVNSPKHTIRSSAFNGKNFFISPEDLQLIETAITTIKDREQAAQQDTQRKLTALDRAVINALINLTQRPQQASPRAKINAPKAIRPVEIPHPNDVIRAGAREIRELLFQIGVAHFNAGEKVTCQLRTYDKNCILVIKTTTDIKTKPVVKTATISEMMSEAKRMRNWGQLTPLKAKEYASQGMGSVTEKCSLRISPKTILSAYANDPTIPFATIGEELFDMMENITGWDVVNYQSTAQTRPQSVFGRTYGIDARSVADHWSGTQSWNCAVFNRSR